MARLKICEWKPLALRKPLEKLKIKSSYASELREYWKLQFYFHIVYKK